MKFLVWVGTITCLGIAGAFGLVKGEEFLYYEKVQAEVVKVVPLCRFKKDDSDAKTTKQESCEKARKRQAAMKLNNYNLVENRKIYFKFVSPVDSQEHTGSLFFSLDSDDLPQMGDTRTYLASKKVKKRLKKFS